MEVERDEFVELAAERLEPGDHLGGIGAGPRPGLRAEPVAEHLDEGEIRRPALSGLAATLEYPDLRALQLVPQLVEEPALSQPGVAHDGHETPFPRDRLLECAAERGHLRIPPGEAGESPTLRRLE